MAQARVTIIPVRDRAARGHFVNYPYIRYRNDPHWIPPLRWMERARFNPRHPFFQHADVQLFLARQDGRVVGRIAAIDDRLHNETHRDNLASFGHFEADSEEAAHALLAVAERWAEDRGRSRIRGPLNSSLNESAGLLIDAFDEDPMVMMPYNPPEYAGFVERAGYSKATDLLAWIVDLPGTVQTERWSRMVSWFQSRHGVTMRSADLSAFAQEIDRFVDVYARAWRDNWGFVAPTAAESRQTAAELKHIVDPELILAADVGGRLVGCAIAIPDLNQVLKGTDGRLFPKGLVRLAARRRIVTQVRLLLFGVIPEWKRTGLAPLLAVSLLSRAAERYRRAEMSWVLEDNTLTNEGIAALGGRQYKTYRVYQKELA